MATALYVFPGRVRRWHTFASCRYIPSATIASAANFLHPINAEENQQINDEAATRVIMLSISPIYLRSTSDPECW
jgi:hypothetical protein